MVREYPLRLTRRRRRFLIEWLAVGVVGVLLLLCLVSGRATTRLDNLVYDGLVRWTTSAASEEIVIVAIDDASLVQLGRWPWARDRHVALFEALARARPRAIVYDILFAEPSPDDMALASAIKGAAPTFLPLLVEVPGANGAAAQISDPVAPIAGAAAGLGHVNIDFDADGVARRVFLYESDGARTAGHLMKVLSDSVSGAQTAPPVMAPAAGLRRGKEVLIPFHGRAGAYRTVPFASVLRGEVPAQVFEGKIVLVGASASGLHDRYATPMGDAGGMDGVEVQANLLQGLREDNIVRPLGAGGVVGLGLVAAAILLIGCTRLSPRGTLLLTAGLWLLLLAVSGAAFVLLKLWIAPAAALVTLAVIYPLWSWRRLEAASGYMLSELDRFRADPDVEADPAATAGDLISRQLDLMDSAIARLRHMRRFVSDAVHALPDPTLVLDPEGRVLLANAQADVLFGATKGTVWSDLVEGWKIGEIDAEGEADAGASDGRIFRLRSVRRHGVDLAENYVITRLTEVTTVRQAAEQRERMLALLTHDMRSPQASILAVLKGAEVAPETARQIAGHANRTLALADNFVQLARAQAETYDLGPLDLSDVVVEAADALWSQASARGIAIAVVGDEEERLIIGDRSLLTRAFINLIDNAVKYSADGRPVTCTLSNAGDEAVCIIADHGAGMTAQDLDRIYQPFQRAGEGKAGGAGLGLALVRAVVQRHGGRVDHASAPGEGTRVTVAFALAAEGGPGPPRPGAA